MDLNAFLNTAIQTAVLSPILEGSDGNSTDTVTIGQIVRPFLPLLSNLLRFSTEFQVTGVVNHPKGKWPETLGSVVLVEGEEYFDSVRSSLTALFRFNQSNPILFGPFLASVAQVETTLDLAANSGFLDTSTPEFEQLQDALDLLTPESQIILGPFPFEIPLIGPEISVPGILSTAFQLSPESSQALRTQFQTTDTQISSLQARDFSVLSVAQLRDRTSVYLQSTQGLQRDMIEFSNDVLGSIGAAYPASVTLPISTALQELQWIRYFLDTIFGSVLALIVVLAILLIYSLLLADVQSKTYEYGMLRGLGMLKHTLIQVILTKSVTFAIPGVLLGLCLSFLAGIPISMIVADYAELDPKIGFYSAALASSMSVGLIMPIIANIIPIRRGKQKQSKANSQTQNAPKKKKD